MEAPGTPADERTPRVDERLQLLIDGVGDALIASDLEGRIIGCNQSSCKLFGYSWPDMLGLSRSDLVLDDERLREVLRERRDSGASRGTLTFVRQGGERFEGEATTVEIPAADGSRRVWTMVHDLSDRRRADQATAALSESTEMLRALTDAAFEAIVIHRDGLILVANRAAEELARVPTGGLTGRQLFDFIAPEAIPSVLERIRQGNEDPYESRARRADGTTYPVEVRIRIGPVNVDGRPARVTAIRDLTERKKLEEEVRHAQKMEALGRLAGGIAHDFNNLLSVIVGAVGLAASEIESRHPAQEALDDVRRAADRAAELTAKLLAFGRKQVLKARPVDVNRSLAGMESMIRTFLGAKAKLRINLDPMLGPVLADPSQLELMLLNLVANARDAMPEGGSIVIETERGFFDAAEAARLGTLPGAQALIRVSDDGVGMDEPTRQRIFEPFFTTKGPGRGSGLGLPTVFGIVKQSQGSVSVESEPGRGTTFSVSLPETSEQPSSLSTSPPAAMPARPDRTILVVEDEPDVRRVVVQVLQRLGYRVFDADGPETALARVREGRVEFDLLLTDVLMPSMSGRQLADEVRVLLPGVAVLYMSGYPDKAFDEGHAPDAGDEFLPKPFTPGTLLAAVERALRARSSPPAVARVKAGQV
jgi:PAS domain S-box-containing protein